MATSAAHQSDITQYGTFTLDSQVFGVNILQMREIIRPIEITKVPRAESFVEGVINLRGAVIPIISLRARFGLPIRPFDKETRIINMEIGDLIVGFIVDSIAHVHQFPASAIEPPPAVAMSIGEQYISGIAREDDQLYILLDADKLVSPDVLEGLAGQE